MDYKLTVKKLSIYVILLSKVHEIINCVVSLELEMISYFVIYKIAGHKIKFRIVHDVYFVSTANYIYPTLIQPMSLQKSN